MVDTQVAMTGEQGNIAPRMMVAPSCVISLINFRKTASNSGRWCGHWLRPCTGLGEREGWSCTPTYTGGVDCKPRLPQNRTVPTSYRHQPTPSLSLQQHDHAVA